MTETRQLRSAPDYRFPPGRPVPLYGPAFRNDPARLYREVRRQLGPVAPVLLDDDVPGWLVLGYREIHQVTSDPQLFARDSGRWHAWHRIPDDWPLRPFVARDASVAFAEGREHRRRAEGIGAALAGVDQFELRLESERIADRLIDAFAGRGTADLMAEYAEPLPLRVLAGLFGVPVDGAGEPVWPVADPAPGSVVRPAPGHLPRDLAASLAGGPDAVAAHARVRDAMRRLLADRQDRPGPDLPSRLLARAAAGCPEREGDRAAERQAGEAVEPQAGHASEQQGDGLAALADDLVLLLTAAQQGTAHWIGNALRLMLTDDRFAMTFSGGRGSTGQALTEVLWADTPFQNFLGRWAVRDTRLGGQHVRAGDLVILGLAAANTDPQVWPDPETVGAAGNHAHLSFSHGEHACPHQAREISEVIAGTAVEVLLDRLPDVLLSTSATALTWHDSVWIRGLTALPVGFARAAEEARVDGRRNPGAPDDEPGMGHPQGGRARDAQDRDHPGRDHSGRDHPGRDDDPRTARVREGGGPTGANTTVR